MSVTPSSTCNKQCVKHPHLPYSSSSSVPVSPFSTSQVLSASALRGRCGFSQRTRLQSDQLFKLQVSASGETRVHVYNWLFSFCFLSLHTKVAKKNALKQQTHVRPNRSVYDMSDECNIHMYHKKRPFLFIVTVSGVVLSCITRTNTRKPTQTTPRHSSTNIIVACCLSPQKGHTSVYWTITQRRAFCALTF